jgi:hypothetical protein
MATGIVGWPPSRESGVAVPDPVAIERPEACSTLTLTVTVTP